MLTIKVGIPYDYINQVTTFFSFGQLPWMTVPSKGPYSENEEIRKYKELTHEVRNDNFCPVFHLSLAVL